MEHPAVGQLSQVMCLFNELRRPTNFTKLPEAIRGLNITQMTTLIYLFDNEERGVFQKDIEAFLRIRRSSVSSLLQTMEKSGWILRLPVPEDARLKWVVLTAQGKVLYHQVRDHYVQMEKFMAQILTEEELSVFTGLMGKLLDNIASLQMLEEPKEV